MACSTTPFFLLLAALGCADDDKAPADDSAGVSAPDDTVTQVDTETTPTDTSTDSQGGEGVEDPDDLSPDTLTDCDATAPPVFEVSYVGASPHVASVPIAVVDGVVNGADIAAGGFCLEQTFAGGGQLTRCGRTDIQGASAYLQGAPAPGQTVSLRLGAVVGESLCWEAEGRDVALGDIPTTGYDYAPRGDTLSTPDYPPAAVGVFNRAGETAFYAMALMDAPSFGVSGGDLLWSFDATDYVDITETPIIEVNRLANGLMSFSVESRDGTGEEEVYDDDFDGVVVGGVDVAGFQWLRGEPCDEPGDADCYGHIHHGNAVMTEAGVTVTMAYELLLDPSGQPYYYEGISDYALVGTVFQGHTVDHTDAMEERFSHSFYELFGQDPNLADEHAPITFRGPSGVSYRPAYYINSADAVQDAVDPTLYHLTGTINVAPFNGFYHLVLTADGEIVEKTLYNNLNEDLTWDTPTGEGPLGPLGHSAEHLGVDPDGHDHFLIYDRNVSILPTDLSECSGFYHVVDRGGVVSVGGPYQNRFVSPEEGDLCGSSRAYGNVNGLRALNIDGFDEPVDLTVMFDNSGRNINQSPGSTASAYEVGVPRLMGLYLNDTPYAPTGWSIASMYVGYNADGDNPAGFNSLILDWPNILVADSPFDLEGL